MCTCQIKKGRNFYICKPSFLDKSNKARQCHAWKEMTLLVTYLLQDIACLW